MRTILFALALLVSTAAGAQTSDSTAISGSESNSNSGANNANTVAPTQQSALQANLSTTFEAARPLKNSTVKTNNAVPLAAAVSFSADNCMSVASGGASGPGFSVGLAKPVADENCQAIRRSQNFGIAMANAANLGYGDTASALLQMQIYEACMAGNGPKRSLTAEACQKLALIGDGAMQHRSEAHKLLQPVPVPQASKRDETFQQKVIITGSNGKAVEFK